MNKRLEALRRLIPEGLGVIDVGTDHGYLPVQLVRDGYEGKIFASDIRPGPLSAARKTAEKAGADDRITFLLCDGLDACPPDRIDTIVIAGMGGDTICGILDRAEWCMSPEYELLLQPMTKSEVLRFWLVNNGFTIEKEELAKDGGKLYQLLCARFCGVNTPLTDAELYLGAYERMAGHPLFPAYLEQQKQVFQKRLLALSSSGAADAGTLRLLRQILDAVRTMEERLHDEGL